MGVMHHPPRVLLTFWLKGVWALVPFAHVFLDWTSEPHSAARGAIADNNIVIDHHLEITFTGFNQYLDPKA